MSWYGDAWDEIKSWPGAIGDAGNYIANYFDPARPYATQAEAQRQAAERAYEEAWKTRDYLRGAGQESLGYIDQGDAQQRAAIDNLYAADGYVALGDGSTISAADLQAYLDNPDKYNQAFSSYTSAREGYYQQQQRDRDQGAFADAIKQRYGGQGGTAGAPAMASRGIADFRQTQGDETLGGRLGGMDRGKLAQLLQDAGSGRTMERFYQNATKNDAPSYVEQLYLDRQAGNGYDPYAQRMLDQGYARLNSQMNARGGFNSGAALANLGNFTAGVNAELYKQNADLANQASGARQARQTYLAGLANMAQGAAQTRTGAYTTLANNTAQSKANLNLGAATGAGNAYSGFTGMGINAQNQAGATLASGQAAQQNMAYDLMKSGLGYIVGGKTGAAAASATGSGGSAANPYYDPDGTLAPSGT